MTSDTRSPEEIERDIEREREGLTDTLDDLQDRFSVEHMARQVTDQFREHGGDIGRSVSEAVKSNPIALALTGVGIAWLMIGNRSDEDYRRRDPYRARPRNLNREGSRDYDYLSSDRRNDEVGVPSRPAASRRVYSGRYGATHAAPDWARTDEEHDSILSTQRIRDAASGAAERASGAASSVAGGARKAGSKVADTASSVTSAARDAGTSTMQSARDMAATASQRATDLKNRLAQGTEDLTEEARQRVVAARQRAVEAREAAAEYARQGRDRAIDIFKDQPLIAGALAVALGAALGAALPRTRVEDDYLGEQSDQLIEEAERIFAEEREKLGNVAGAVRDEAVKAARDLKEEADDTASTAAQTAKDKAASAGQRVADAAKTEADKQGLGDVKKSPKSSS